MRGANQPFQARNTGWNDRGTAVVSMRRYLGVRAAVDGEHLTGDPVGLRGG